MTTHHIPTLDERIEQVPHVSVTPLEQLSLSQAEVAELRARVAELESELEKMNKLALRISGCAGEFAKATKIDRRPKLAPRQAEVFAFIKSHIAEKRYPPTMQEIANHIGVSSCNSVHAHLMALQRKDYIDIDPGISRGIRVLKVGESILS